MNIFQEISRTNKAYCASLGLPSDTYDRPLSDAEANGTPLSPEEAEIARFKALGINDKAAGMFAALNNKPAKSLAWNPRQRPAPAPHCIVEVAFPASRRDEQEALVGASIQSFYDDCRQRGSWVGD